VAIEEVLKRWTKVFQDQNVIVTFSSKPMYTRNANGASETLVHTVLVLDLRVLCVDDLELDGDIAFRNDVDSAINDTCMGFSKSYERRLRFTHRKSQTQFALSTYTYHRP
jgi:hypothetical protein